MQGTVDISFQSMQETLKEALKHLIRLRDKAKHDIQKLIATFLKVTGCPASKHYK